MVYQFKVTLQGIEPPIWRRFQVPKNFTLHEFAFAIEDTMQWYGICLYRYILERSIIVPDYDAGDSMMLPFEIPLSSIINCREIEFEYNLVVEEPGTQWMHTIEFEGEVVTQQEEPRCLEGERACPPENLKGCAKAYDDFLKIVMDKNNSVDLREETLYINFMNEDFDSEHFDVNKVRYRRATLPGMDVTYW